MLHRHRASALVIVLLAFPCAATGQDSSADTTERPPGLSPLALGDATTQLVYTPVTPCRLADTRMAGGSIAAGTVREFRVTGGDLSPQGGSPAGCGVPNGPATSAIVNFVAVNPAGAGNLRAWAYSTPPVGPPTASVLNYAPVPGLNIANGIAVPICNPSQTTCTYDLRVQADTSGTHLVADVVGYFERFPVEQAIPPGTILEYGGPTVPPGFLICDGSQVGRTQYPRLFAAVGTAFGAGDGVATFHLPDFRGRFARGWDSGAGRDPDAVSREASGPGGNIGNAVGSLQEDQFRSHRHFVNSALNVQGTSEGGGPITDWSPRLEPTDYQGGNETRPVNVYVNKIIKY